MLLLPVVFTLRPAPAPGARRQARRTLRAVGYDVEPFGGDAVRVSAVPGRARRPRSRRRRSSTCSRDLLERENAGGEMAEARHRVCRHHRLPLRGARRPAAGPRGDGGDRGRPLAGRAARGLPARPSDPRARAARRRQPLVRPHGMAAAVKGAHAVGLDRLLAGPAAAGHGPAGHPGGGDRVLRHPEHARDAAHDAGRRAAVHPRLADGAPRPPRAEPADATARGRTRGTRPAGAASPGPACRCRSACRPRWRSA